MPKGPQGQKRPADAIGCAVMVAKIATGEITEELKQPSSKVRSGQAEAKARADALTKRGTVGDRQKGGGPPLGVMVKPDYVRVKREAARLLKEFSIVEFDFR